MSKPISVMDGAHSEGLNHVSDAGLKGMITLKGDLGADWMAAVIKELTDVDLPENGCISLGAISVAWMAKDEVLILCDYDQADHLVGQLDTKLSDHHVLAVNVSDARALFKVEGPSFRDVLAKVTPTPLGDVKSGQFRRSRIGQIAAAFWMESDRLGYVICFRSVGEHMFMALAQANTADAPLRYYSA